MELARKYCIVENVDFLFVFADAHSCDDAVSSHASPQPTGVLSTLRNMSFYKKNLLPTHGQTGKVGKRELGTM